jgi:hypothetical protein
LALLANSFIKGGVPFVACNNLDFIYRLDII